jgi:DNA-binding response OmpR family regulator
LLASTDSLSADSWPLITSENKKAIPFKSTLLVVPFLLLAGFIGYAVRRKNPVETDPNLILIGASQFDKRHMVLSFENKKVTLSNKEAELLSLLHASANKPVERDVILQRVWGDEGDYVGRTLDVFISKLRKKLEADASVKIVNIRSVGYKLIM